MAKLGVIMDPIESINFAKDSTLAILLEAQNKGFCIYYIKPNNLYFKNNTVFAKMQQINVFNKPSCWFKFINDKKIDIPLHKLNVTLMRKDPPVDQNYIYTTQLLNIAKNNNNAYIINDPESLLCFNEKTFITNFIDCYPPTLISANIQEITKFIEKNKEIILKPLNSFGGNSIFKIDASDPNINVIIETLTKNKTCQIMAQKYINEITQTGDKRILMIDGKPIPYALARFPNLKDFRGNLAKGGKGKVVPLTKKDMWICNQIGPTLKEKGLTFVGLDVIGEYLTEINITSPTCIRELEKSLDINISELLLNSLQI